MSISNIRFISSKDGIIKVTFQAELGLKYTEETRAIQNICNVSNVINFSGVFVRKSNHKVMPPIVLKDGIYYECTDYQIENRWLLVCEGRMLLCPINEFKEEEYHRIEETVISYSIFNFTNRERETYAFDREELANARESILEKAHDIDKVTIGNVDFIPREFLALMKK